MAVFRQICVFMFAFLNTGISSSNDSNLALMDHISRWYGPHSALSVHCRPPSLTDGRTRLLYKNTLVQLVDLDVKSQLLTGRFWEHLSKDLLLAGDIHHEVSQQWEDPRLVWDPAEFNNATYINVPVGNNIWQPDIVLYNQYDSERRGQHAMKVYHNGTIMWIPATLYRVGCSMDITYFPWDTHQCRLVFGSWALTENDLVLEVAEDRNVNPSQIIHSTEWMVDGGELVANSTPFGEIGNWTLVTYSLTFHRRVAFFTYVITIPSVIMSFLTTLVFCLPPDMVEGINIALTLFLSYFVLLMIVVESTPRSGLAIPLIGQYLILCMSLLAVSIFGCTIVYNIATKVSTRKFSHSRLRCLKRLAGVLGVPQTVGAEQGITNDLDKSANIMDTPPASDVIGAQWRLLAGILQRLLLIAYLILNATALIIIVSCFVTRDSSHNSP